MLDISQLPTPDFAEAVNYEAILTRRKAQFIAAYPAEQQAEWAAILALESDPITKLLEESAYNELILRERINRAALSTTLAFAVGEDLDVVAANSNTERQLISEADPEATPPRPEVWESDERLRARAQLALEKVSTAGHGAGYCAHALDAHPLVEDVTVTSPQPAHVQLYFLAQDGTADDELPAISQAIITKLNGWDIRPIADRVAVDAAQLIDYQLSATIYLYYAPESEPIIQAATARAQQFIHSARRLGRDIRLSAIAAALHVDGVQRVEIASPVQDLIIHPHQAAICAGLSIQFGGFDD